MSIHHSRLFASVCVLAMLSAYGCDDDWKRDRVDRFGPSPISFRPLGQPLINSVDFFSRGVTLLRPTVTPLPTGSVACPIRQPFLAPFTILTTGNGVSDLFLTEVQMRFVDRVGVIGGSMTIPRPQLVERFGHTSIPAFDTRPFEFAFPFGCVGEPVGTVAVVVVSGDSVGRDFRTSLALSVH
jgi:hypothetical protein